MIISHKHRFIFVKTKKTAGTSIEVLLSSLCGEQDICTPIMPPVTAHVARNHEGFYNHKPAHEICSIIGESVWSSYYTFCVERNPWDKVISYFHMRKGYWKLPEEYSLADLIKDRDLPVDHTAYTVPGQPCELMVNRVLRYENLDKELGEVMSLLGLPYSGSLGIFAKSDFRTDRRPYQAVFTPSQAEAVAEAFAAEIKMFGYAYNHLEKEAA